MFDMKRGSGRQDSDEFDDELDSDRLGSAPGTSEPRREAPPSAARVREAAIVGPSIHIDGDLRGEEDLIIEGTVNGTVHLREHSLTVGSNGKVRANVFAKSVFVDGTVEGDLYGAERVAIRKSGSVQGNIVSPRISLDDGARFKGTVEMDQKTVESAFGRKASATGGLTGSAPPSQSKEREESAKSSGSDVNRPASQVAAAGGGAQSAGKPFGSDKTTAGGGKS